jgi:hypothetical protein
MIRVTGTTASEKVRLPWPIPSTALSTEIAGVSMPSP